MANRDPAEKFREFTRMTYIEQSKAFLNAYWHEYEGEAENVWDWTHQFIELDIDKGKEGSDLDEFNAHRFLERLGETRTIKDLRDELRDIDMDFNKRMAIIEYLLFRNQKTIGDFVRRPQGENTAEVQHAQHALEEAQRSLEEAREAEGKAVIDAQIAEEKAELSAIAERELRAALSDLHEQEENYERTKQALTTRSEDPNLGVVQRNKAKNELSQLLAEDPLPLRRAKITTEAATKKAEKAVIAAQDAANQARDARAEAEVKVVECFAKFQEAENYLEELRSRPGGGQGAIWWINRELTEAKKYLPKRRQ